MTKVATLEVEITAPTGRIINDLSTLKRATNETMGETVKANDRAATSAARFATQQQKLVATFGMSASELQQYRAALQAINAEKAGRDDLAARIRGDAAALASMTQAAAEAAAQEARLAVEARAAAQAEQELAKAAASAAAAMDAQKIRDAAAAHAIFEAKVRQGAAALREQEAAEKALSREAATAALRSEAAAAAQLATEHARLAAMVRGSHDAQMADAAAADRLRAATDPLYAATVRLNAEIAESTRLYHVGATAPAEYARQQQVLATRLREVGQVHQEAAKSLGKTGFALRQTAIQIPDIVQGLLSGQHASTIFIQQGGQIAQIGMMAEGGLKGFALQLGAIALRFVPLLPVMAGGIAMFSALKDRVEDQAGLKAYVATLGLTHQELKKLGDVSVTTGDLFAGFVKTLGLNLDGIGDKVHEIWVGIGTFLGNVFKGIGASIYGLMVGSYRAIVETWRDFPRMLGDVFVQGVNGAAGAIEFLLNKSIAGINKLSDWANGILKAAGLDAKFGQISPIQLGRLENQYAGAAKQVGSAWGRNLDGAVKEALAATDRFMGNWATNAASAARDRIKGQADELSYDRRASEAAAAHRKELADAAKAAREAAAEEKRWGEMLLTIMGNAQKALHDFNSSFKMPGDPEADIRRIVDAIDQVGVAKERLADFDREVLERQTAAFDSAADAVKRYADAFTEPFGRGGAALAKMTDALLDYENERKRIANLVSNGEKTEAQAAGLRGKAQISAYADTIGAAKGFFSEHSKIYKGLQAAEQAYRAVQLAMSIAAMFQSSAETAVKVADSAAQATAAGAAGVAEQSKLPFPANIAAMAATAAALVSFGVAMLGGGGGGSAKPVTNTGTGSVLGDNDAKSESITNALSLLRDIDDATLNVSRDMLQSLRSIENNISGLASLLVRTGNISGASASVDTGFKSSLSGAGVGGAVFGITGLINETLGKVPIVGGIISGVVGAIKSLFGTKTSVVGSGLYAGSQSLSDILGGGFDLQTYADVEKKKKFLGLTASKKYSTTYGAADDQLGDQFTLILRSFNSAIMAAAGPLGVATSDIESRLSGFAVDLGKIDFTGLSGDEISAKLSAVFGAAADDMAAAAMPGIDRFQRVGEGAFETLVRVASTVEQVDAAFQRLGVTTGSMGADIDMSIAGMFDSVSDFTSAADTYFQTYYSASEQAAAKTAQMSKAFDGLGLTMPDTLANFRHLVEAQDLTTTAGQQTYATLLQLAPAFADLKGDLNGTVVSARSAADILSERRDLERQLLEVQGDTAAIRALDLAKLDDTNRALQEHVWALQDEQTAAAAATQAAQQAAAAQQAIDTQRLGLEGQLLQLSGDTAEIRRREVEALDPSLRALQLRIYALQDEQAATTAAAQAAQAATAAQEQAAQEAATKAAQIESERAGLQQQLWTAEGNTAALRQAELDALDPMNRGLQLAIWRWQDAATAADAAAQAEQAAAQAQAAIDQQRMSLQQQLWQEEGNVVAMREAELAAIDPLLQGMQLAIWRWQDGKAAAAAAAQAAEQLAQAERATADERQGLIGTLWQLTGDTASIRAAELAKLDPSNRALQSQIYAIQDAQEAAKAADALRQAWSSVGDSIMAEVKRIRGLGDEAGGDGFATLLGRFNAATDAARLGDQAAASSLPEMSKALLDAAALAATSRQELDRVQAQTAASLEETYGTILGMTGSSPAASTISDSAAIWSSVEQSRAATDDMVTELKALRAEVVQLRSDTNAGNATIAGNTGSMKRTLDNVTSDGGDTLAVKVAA